MPVNPTSKWLTKHPEADPAFASFVLDDSTIQLEHYIAADGILNFSDERHDHAILIARVKKIFEE